MFKNSSDNWLRRNTNERGVKPRRRRIWRWVLLLLLLAFFAWMVYLEETVRDQFDGRKWDLPAKVYGRSVELFVGAELPVSRVRSELQSVGYVEVWHDGELAHGEFKQLVNGLEWRSRHFKFWDEEEPSRLIRATWHQGQIVELIDQASNNEVDIIRMEPQLIGGIYPNHGEDRILVKLDQVPQSLLNALISVEDSGFYDHFGISIRGIARAAWVNVRSGRLSQGGSTLTQQLIKNFYLTNERTLWRKINEVFMAILLELHYSKDEILEAYINEVYLAQTGNRAVHGFGLASQYFFGKSLESIRVHEAALLAGLVKGPSYYNPRTNASRALKRRDVVLASMLKEGKITQEEYQSAIAAPIGLAPIPVFTEDRYPAFMGLVKSHLNRDYKEEDLRSAGLRIYTTFDPFVQAAADRSLAGGLDELVKRYGEDMKQAEGAIVVTSSETGDVLAITGGKDSRYSGFNRALEASRQVGSLAKPAVYLAAIEQDGYELNTLIDDDPVEIELPNGDVWAPKNYDRESHGLVPALVALSMSYNQATVRLAQQIGFDQVVKTLARLGLDQSVPVLPSTALGSFALTPYEVANLYQTIAAGGFNSPARAITAVVDSSGKLLNRYPLEVTQKFDASSVALLTFGLQSVVKQGTAQSVPPSLKALGVAGKTGTTNDQRDSWFAGFSGSMVAVVWIGRDDNAKLPVTGATGALQIWSRLMTSVPQEPLVLQLPGDLREAWYDPGTGETFEFQCDGRLNPIILRRKQADGQLLPCSIEQRARSWVDRIFN